MTIREIVMALFFSVPGLVFVANAQTDLFGKVGIFVAAWIVTALMAGATTIFVRSGEAFQAIAADPRALKKQKELKYAGLFAVAVWIIVMFLALLLGGGSYVGAAIYGVVVSWLDRRFIRPENKDSVVSMLTKD